MDEITAQPAEEHGTVLKRLGLLLAAGTYLLTDALFLSAFFSPAQAAIIYINKHGEAQVELITMVLIGTPIVLYSIWRSFGEEE